MEKMRCLCAVCALFLLLSGCAQPQPEETTPATTESAEFLSAQEIGNSSYRCITGESAVQEIVSDAKTTHVKAFSHRIYNPEGEYIVTLTTTVTTSLSSDENAAEVTSVSGSLSDAQMEGFTVSEHVSGDTATVVLYRAQLSICHFQYRSSPDGTIEFL